VIAADLPRNGVILNRGVTMIYEFTVGTEYDGKKLSSFLHSSAMMSSSLIRSVKFTEDGLLIDGEKAQTDALLCRGQTVTITVPQSTNLLTPSSITVPIVYENESALVYDKPAGIATHPTLNYPYDTLANVYAARISETGENDVFRPVNRLDKNTSGLVLAAKDRYAAPLLAKSARKQYYAITEGIVPDDNGRIDAPIARASESIIQRIVTADGAPSVTEYEVLERFEKHTLVLVKPCTGRTHQIRVHFAHLGFPLAGDTLYGGSDQYIDRTALHCAIVHFKDPITGRMIKVQSALPEDMKGFLDTLYELNK